MLGGLGLANFAELVAQTSWWLRSWFETGASPRTLRERCEEGPLNERVSAVSPSRMALREVLDGWAAPSP